MTEKSTEKQYEVPEREIARKRRRRRWVAIFAVVALLVGGGVWYLVQRTGYCDGVEGTTGQGFGLHRDEDDPEGQCLGWTVDRAHAFGTTDPRVQAVVDAIVKENQAVAASSGASGYVRVAVMMPMVSRQGSKLDANSILHALQGARTALEVVNSDPQYGDVRLKVQLVLANIGWDQKSWRGVVEQLGGLTGGDHPLVAVTGLGVSVPETREAAAALNARWGLPSIGAVLTADDMTTRGTESADALPSLFKVSPSNHDYALALKAVLDRDYPAATSGFLVADRNNDNYVESLGKAFVHVFGDFHLDEHRASFTGSTTDIKQASNLFQPVIGAINAFTEANAGKPAVVLYAGRDADLPSFVRSLGTRVRKDGDLVLATGMTGLTVTTSEATGTVDQLLTTADLADAKVRIVAAASTDVVGWKGGGDGVPKRFDKFLTTFTKDLGYAESDLDDGYAVMHHDAVAAAVKAARSIYSNSDGARLPTPLDVRNGLYSLKNDQVEGASGSFSWEEATTSYNDLWPVGKPVPIITFPRTAQPSAPYTTACRVLVDSTSLKDYDVVDC
ncbi:hypothetical protein [Umezawaea sp. Da 62-37]|uniref:hypothetical protein n=1 Tax=Umezawaea sp. Da 62-37 TaxID=3075927 RepID=UPI0028F6DBD9|nr:hypothetical protein [Umezawaea sp. Da 62-37]WNV84136.1 hypothetical protein RM788_39145 [Umezawaea sp. Da 62-37]